MPLIHLSICYYARRYGWSLGFLQGDRSYGLYLLVAISGGLTALMFWKLVHKLTESHQQASLLAILFGFTSSQLIFSSFTETYAFSALGLVTFLYLIVSQSRLRYQVAAGAFVFGITITNFIQAGMARLIIHFNLEEVACNFLCNNYPRLCLTHPALRGVLPE